MADIATDPPDANQLLWDIIEEEGDENHSAAHELVNVQLEPEILDQLTNWRWNPTLRLPEHATHSAGDLDLEEEWCMMEREDAELQEFVDLGTWKNKPVLEGLRVRQSLNTLANHFSHKSHQTCYVKSCNYPATQRECTSCHRTFCAAHAPVYIRSSTHSNGTRWYCTDCWSYIHPQLGLRRSWTTGFKKLRSQYRKRQRDDFERHLSIMIPVIQQLLTHRAASTGPIQKLSTSLTRLNPLTKLTWSVHDSWTACAHCGTLFGRLALRLRCELCDRICCSECGLHKAVVQPSLLANFSDLAADLPIEASACLDCVCILSSLEFSNDTQRRAALQHQLQDIYTKICELGDEIERDLSNAITLRVAKSTSANTLELDQRIAVLRRQLSENFLQFHTMLTTATTLVSPNSCYSQLVNNMAIAKRMWLQEKRMIFKRCIIGAAANLNELQRV